MVSLPRPIRLRNLGGQVRVLVAGDWGCMGAVLVPFLRTAGHEVDGLDISLHEGCDFGPGPADLGARHLRGTRDAEAGHLVGCEAVACFAAPCELVQLLCRCSLACYDVLSSRFVRLRADSRDARRESHRLDVPPPRQRVFAGAEIAQKVY
jgi:hypothetical protein